MIDSTNLEIFLESLQDNMILIAVTFDEASFKYKFAVFNLFNFYDLLIK